MPSGIKIEDDFLFKIYQQEKTGIGEIYPKVSSIPKGKKITPDIDLLIINRYQPFILGFEVKLLRKKDPLQTFYLGLGEALCYFQHGVDQVHLILGCFNMNPSELDNVEDKLRKVCNFLKKTIFSYSYPYLGIDIFREDRNYSTSLKEVSTDAKFTTHNYKEVNHKKDCLLNNEFEWGKRWLRNREKNLTKKE